jgi:hypothetical protein
VKGLLESKTYLFNPNSATAVAAYAQALVLAEINNILNGEASLNTAATSADRVDGDNLLETNINARSSNDNINYYYYWMSPLSCLNSTGSGDKKKKYPATMMAEASLLNLTAIREEQREELHQLSLEREWLNDMLKNVWEDISRNRSNWQIYGL